MADDFYKNKIEELVQLMATNQDMMEKQMVVLERIAFALEDLSDNDALLGTVREPRPGDVIPI